MDKNTDFATNYRANLETKAIGDLRKMASNNFGIKLTREHTKQDIIDLIVAAVSKANYAEASDGELKPGWATIKILPVAGKVTFPVFLNCNGYHVFVPIGVEVDVPIKVIEVLNNAQEMKKTKNEFDEYIDTFELSYPFQVLATNPGPDPRPGREAATDKKWKPFRKFFDKYGYWPSQKVLQAATTASINFNAFEAEASED